MMLQPIASGWEDLVQAYQLLRTQDLNKLDLRFAEKISGEDDWDEVKSALNNVPSSLRRLNFRLEGYDELCHVSYKGLSFLVSGLAMRVFLLNIILQKIKKTIGKTCFNTQDLVLLKPGGFFWKVWEMQKKGSTPATWQKLEHLDISVGRCHATKEANSPISPLRTSADGVGAEARPRCRCTVQWDPKNGVLELSMKAEIHFKCRWLG